MKSPTRLEVSMDEQVLKLIGDDGVSCEFSVSTAIKGMGFQLGSYRTPTGRFVISEKIGEGEAEGTIFKQRVPVGVWNPGDAVEGDLILTRVLRLEGLDHANANTHERCIYLHGTNREEMIGKPASQGCIRLNHSDMVRLYDLVQEGTLLEIFPHTRPQGKLLFIDCDSTLSEIEGIDELARARGGDVFAQVVALTNAAMEGEVPIGEVFPRRMEMIRPDRALCDLVGELYVNTMVSGAQAFIAEVKKRGWHPVILSGGFAALIEPLAKALGIDHVEAVPLMFDQDGSYLDYGRDYPTTRNMGKNEIIREWKNAVLPERVVMIGDGVSDLETTPDVDLFIGFGGVVSRSRVKESAGFWAVDFEDPAALLNVMESHKSKQ